MRDSSGHRLPSLDVKIEGAIDEFEEECEQMWADPQDAQTVNRASARAAELILRASDTITVRTSKALIRSLETILSDLDMKEYVFLALQPRLAREHLPDTEQMARRTLDLANLVVAARPTDRVRRFLRRASRLYITGLVNECVIMCRAILESALDERFARAKKQKPDKMRLRLDQALQGKWLDPETRRDAETVWARGNTAVHKDPDVVRDSLDTIRRTMRVLDNLYRTSGA
jgi:hypothetical protein